MYSKHKCRLAFILYINLLSIQLYGQNLKTLVTQKIPEYIKSNQQTKIHLVTMPFAKASFIDTSGMYLLANKTIVSVHYVYTDYPSNQNLRSLQNSRIELLVNSFPFLNNTTIDWKVYRQTNGFSKATASNMLHGFVITYREPQGNVELRNKEIQLIKNAIPPPKSLTINDGKRRWQKVEIKGIYPNPKEFVQHLQYGDSVIKVATKDLQQNQILSPKELHYFGKKDSLWVVLLVPKKIMVSLDISVPKDSSVLQYFSQFTPTKKYAIVADVTASMSVYNVQLLTILNNALQTNFLEGISFFNDGDNTANSLKKIGNTNGIYSVATTNAINIQKNMIAAMQNGSGGDVQENNCEAILKTIESFSSIESIVLIADNVAPVRDIELVKSISKPVHIIIGGKALGLNLHLLNIAYSTKGSIYYDNILLNNFSMFSTSKPVLIRGVWYYLKNNVIEYWY